MPLCKENQINTPALCQQGNKEELMWSNAGFYGIDDRVFFSPVCHISTPLRSLYFKLQ